MKVFSGSIIFSCLDGLGAAIRIEKEAPGDLPLIYLACRRHKLERDLNAVWKTCFPGPTKAPADALCEKINKLDDERKLPSELELESCQYVFRDESPFFNEQRERIGRLCEKMADTSEKKGCLPRDDYRYLLNLIQVNIRKLNNIYGQ